jgi:hypothetical protein
VNCNIYQDKADVWINGGPAANGLTDGTYFFAVVEPDGSKDPNDGSPELLSTDAYTDRTFVISGGEILSTSGTHLTDGASPNLKIQLAPYLDTSNPGGEYKVALCRIDTQESFVAATTVPPAAASYDPEFDPVDPSTCKTDNFKVKNFEEPCLDPDNCRPPVPFSVLSGLKYYDANRNGQLDAGEPGIANWPIDFSAGVPNTVSTDSSGLFQLQLDPDTYTFQEEVAGAPWSQTGNTVNQFSDLDGNSTLLSNKIYTVTAVDGGSTSGLNFGNVCTVRNRGGLTLGFWSNANGKAILSAHAAGFATAINTTYWLVNANGTRFTVTGTFTQEYNAFRTWILSATSTNASYMLSAQLITTAFDRAYGGLANYLVQNPVAFGGFTVGQWITIDQLVNAAGNATDGFTKTYPLTKASGTPRNNATAYQTLFNAINNRLATVTALGPGDCPTPVFAS